MIKNAADTLLNENPGTLPQVNGAMRNWFSQITIKILTKSVKEFKAIETAVEVNFLGVWESQPPEMLEIKPEGQRSWDWVNVWCESAMIMNIDDFVVYQDKIYRVMKKTNWSIYGYVQYELVKDYQ